MRDELIIEFSPAHGARRRVTFTPASGDGSHWWRIEEERRGCSWREVGREPVTEPVVDESPVGPIDGVSIDIDGGTA